MPVILTLDMPFVEWVRYMRPLDVDRVRKLHNKTFGGVLRLKNETLVRSGCSQSLVLLIRHTEEGINAERPKSKPVPSVHEWTAEQKRIFENNLYWCHGRKVQS